MVWLVISGPLIVVVASFVSFGLAASGAEAVISDPPPAPLATTGAMQPALTARNHAATPH